MNVEELLEMMEETLEAGTIVPFSASKRMVDVDRMRDIIDEVRNNLPDEIREQLMSQDIGKLPKPEEVQSLMQAFTAGGLNTFGDMKQTVESGPINVKLAKSIALQKANADGSQGTVSAQSANIARRALSEANLWLDTACTFDPT